MAEAAIRLKKGRRDGAGAENAERSGCVLSAFLRGAVAYPGWQAASGIDELTGSTRSFRKILGKMDKMKKI